MNNDIGVKRAHEGTRNICHKIGTKILNACDDYWYDDKTSIVFGTVTPHKTDAMETLANKMMKVSAVGYITHDDWDAVHMAIRINNELKMYG